jgi:hypothetical protein
MIERSVATCDKNWPSHGGRSRIPETRLLLTLNRSPASAKCAHLSGQCARKVNEYDLLGIAWQYGWGDGS